MSSTRQVSRGFTLISALFVLVVVSSLGVYLVALSTGQHLTSALSVRSVQTLYAAQSGMEWVIYRLDLGDNCAALPASLMVDGFTVSIDSCSAQSVTEGSDTYPIYDVVVTARIGSFGDADFVTRQVNAVILGS